MESPGTRDSDVHISRENQKKINTFAIRNGWLEELNEELKLKQNEIKSLEDVEADILLMEDPDETVPILIGDCYVHYTQERAGDVIQSLLTKAKGGVKKCEERIIEIRAEMARLKAELYSQFGDNINLENEEEED